jgi:3-hydroxyisobutyrate dehydrogenase-like beta-hydroxyacid dehydrogenase
VSVDAQVGLRVGFVGLGSQGGPIAQRILDSGFAVTVWARRPEQALAFEKSGARIASDRIALGEASDVLCVCVVADRDVDEVLSGPEGALARMSPGSIVVVHSTVHPDTCRRLQADHPALHVVDAPVSGGGLRAAKRELLVMVGGAAEAIARCRPVLETFANPLVHLGPLGAGQEAKLLNNALFAAQLGLAADAFTTAIARGLDPKALATVLAAGSGRSYAADLVAGGDYRLEAMSRLAGPLLAKDVGILTELLATERPALIEAAHATLVTMGLAASEGSET